MVTEDATSDTPELPDPWLGKVVDGRYRVLERIGQGGMGVVYKVEHATIGKIAAMKLLHTNFVADRELLQRFQAEAEAISKLNHPNIVQVFDFGREASTAYIVMEYLKGEDLGLILRRDGSLQLPRCVSIVAQICDALTEAHELGIIHRDLKPENIRVSRTKDGQDFVKVLDFGLAKMIADEDQAAITAQGSLVGTPYYMAPEQIRAEEVDHRCDIYSLGALLYHMLTGRNAFAAKTPMGVLTKHITEDLQPPSEASKDVSIEVDSVVMRAMAKAPGERYDSAQSLKQALVSVLWNSGEVPALPNAADLPITEATRRGSDANNNGAVSVIDVRSCSTDIAFLPTGTYNGNSIDRLQREDIAFERGLRRSRLFKLLLLLPVLAAAAFAAYWFGFRREPIIAPSEEVEPNNELLRATLLASGKAVRGHIGQRVSATESDRDWYVLNVKGGTDALSADVSGIPNMDITLELYDSLGGRLFTADCTGTGGGESIARWPLAAGKYYLLVREMWRVGERPTENVTDSYHLVASWSRWEPGWELEPNDSEKLATAVVVGQKVRGILGSLTDIDAFQVNAKTAATISGTVSGVEGVDLVIHAVSSSGKKRTFNRSAKGKPEDFELQVAPDRPAYLLLQRRHRRKRNDANAPAGLKAFYELVLKK